MNIVLLIGVLAIMAFGTFAAVLPMVPGPALVWFGAMIYGALTNFQEIGAFPLIILTLLMILGSTSHTWLPALGIKAAGGSIWTVVGGMIGLVIGTIVLFPVGGLVGVVVGSLAVEMAITRDWRKAVNVGGGTAGGYLLGMVSEFFVAAIMDVIFLVSLYLAHRVA